MLTEDKITEIIVMADEFCKVFNAMLAVGALTSRRLTPCLLRRHPLFALCPGFSSKRYVCEKLTATFTENGMSLLIKGVFWPIAD